ncbi:MAG: CD225/dispanin family protein [Bacteroidales bacterium]|nr:CD225/dispanin family protein [Bacteroidales bacterium]
MKYYMHVNGQQMGPFEESELMINGLTPNTPVWADGMASWIPAGQVAALSYLFAGQVPPYGGQPQQPQYAQPQPQYATGQHMPMPPTNLVWGILVTIFCCLPFGIVSIVKASQVTSLYNQGQYAEALEASKSAGKWAMWGAISCVIAAVLYLICVFLFVGSLGAFAHM